MHKKVNLYNATGILYIVPTPIGNLSDITHRALKILKNVNLIAVENIQHTNILLKYFKIQNTLTTFNKHNETEKSKYLIQKLKAGKNIALVSNAGTPLINDPGHYLIKQCHYYNIKIIPLPGPCAAITALSASGISSNRFCYEGFLPSKKKNRCDLLHSLKKESRTIIFYESKHRILQTIQDIIEQIDGSRHLVIAREITKTWESIYGSTANMMLDWLQSDCNRYKKGEIVIILEGYKEKKDTSISNTMINTFNVLNNFLSSKQSILITSKIHNINKNDLYRYITKNVICTQER